MVDRNQNLRELAMVFVDYEHWYYSMINNFGAKPNVRAWYEELSQIYDLFEVSFFADFSKSEIAGEIGKLREVSNIIIETRNASSHSAKDFTDFIMLDCIYQKAILTRHIHNFIIFTGDGHFNSVVSFLRNRCGIHVGVYGVKNAFSNQLRATADWWVEIAHETHGLDPIQQAVIDNFRYLEEKRDETGQASHITFWKTAQHVARYYGLNQEAVTDAMRQMLSAGYICQEQERIDASHEITVLSVDWAKVNQIGAV